MNKIKTIGKILLLTSLFLILSYLTIWISLEIEVYVKKNTGLLFGLISLSYVSFLILLHCAKYLFVKKDNEEDLMTLFVEIDDNKVIALKTKKDITEEEKNKLIEKYIMEIK